VTLYSNSLRTFDLIGMLKAKYEAEERARGSTEAFDLINKRLESANLSMDSVMAQVLAAKLSEIERIDRMTTNAEIRCNAVFREIAMHRAGFTKALRRASDDIEDAEYEEIVARQDEDKRAA
jgi:hypothetical protein